MSAIDELKHRSWSTKERIDAYCLKLNETMNIMPVLGAPDVHQQKMHSSTNSELDALLGAANQMFKAAEIADVPEVLINHSLHEIVHNLRNLLEHWDENQIYFSDFTLPIPRKNPSAIWFRGHFPGQTPWAGGWTNLEGYTVGGALFIGELYSQMSRLVTFAEQSDG